MNKENIKIQKELKNAEGKRILQKTKLEYAKKIIEDLQKEPSVTEIVTSRLDVSNQYFFESLSGSVNENIVYYDEALQITRKLTQSKEKGNAK